MASKSVEAVAKSAVVVEVCVPSVIEYVVAVLWCAAVVTSDTEDVTVCLQAVTAYLQAVTV